MQMMQKLGMRIITDPVLEAEELYPWRQIEMVTWNTNFPIPCILLI